MLCKNYINPILTIQELTKFYIIPIPDKTPGTNMSPNLPCRVLNTTKVYHNQGTSTNPATKPVTQVKPMIVARRTYKMKFVFGLKHPVVVIIFMVEFFP